jgi:5'-nucleotidase
MKEIRLEERSENGKTWGWALDGSPADCVKFALTKLDIPMPDLVLSGINPGANTGNNILYSGTVAAALEGAMFSLPAIALSVAKLSSFHKEKVIFAGAVAFVPQLIDQVLEQGLPPYTALNVNVPNIPPGEIEGVVVSKQGRAWFIDVFDQQEKNEAGEIYMNVGTQFINSKDGADADDRVVRDKKISITPLHYDMTHYDFREKLRTWKFHTDMLNK